MWDLNYKESSELKNCCFWTVVLEETLESPLDSKEIQPVHSKGNQSWIFIGRTDTEAKTPIIWPFDAKNWLIWKDPDAGKDWSQEEKRMTEEKMAGWHHWLNGHEFEYPVHLQDLVVDKEAWHTAIYGVTKSRTGLSDSPDWMLMHGLPRWHNGKESPCQCRRHKWCGFHLWIWKISWRRKWQLTPVFFPGKFHGQRSLVSYSPWGHKESDMTEWLRTHTC